MDFETSTSLFHLGPNNEKRVSKVRNGVGVVFEQTFRTNVG